MSLESIHAESRRRALVDVLAEAQDYEEYEAVLTALIGEMRLQASAVRADLPWLEANGLALLSGPVYNRRAKLTALGLDAARGLVRVHGLGRKID